MRIINKIKNHNLPTGFKIIIFSIIAGAVFISPLLIYIVIGPSGGNPIGLGLLAMAGGVIAQLGILIGLVVLVAGLFKK